MTGAQGQVLIDARTNRIQKTEHGDLNRDLQMSLVQTFRSLLPVQQAHDRQLTRDSLQKPKAVLGISNDKNKYRRNARTLHSSGGAPSSPHHHHVMMSALTFLRFSRFTTLDF